MAKGKHSPHPALQDRRTVIHMDFRFLSTKEVPNSAVTVLTAIDVRAQLAMGAVVPSKSVNRYALTELKRFIYETGRTQAPRNVPTNLTRPARHGMA